MALVVKDRVKETTATTGTGTLTLAGAVTGFQSFSSALSDGDTTYYAISESSTGSWEVGLGTFTASGTTLARTTVLASSNSGSAINLTAGAADVFITQPAGKAAYFDASGDLVLNQDPTSNLQAATKQYVDTIAAAGLHYHDPVRVEQEGNLNATYDNGTSGVGATLTNAGTQAALVIDGVTMVLNDRVLIYEQTNAAHNGVYTVTNVGSASTNWVLTRATDADSYGPSDPDALGQGDAFFVQEGAAGAGETYVMTTEGTITFGTTDITFSQISATQIYSAGDGLTLTGTTFAAGAGTGVTVNANDIAIGQPVGTGDTVTFATVNANLSGNVTGDVTGDLTGNADTATAWATGRTFSLTGDVTGSVTGVDGSGNVSIATTYNNDVVLGTDTSGNYVATGAVSGNGLSGSASAEGATFTVTSNATNANTASTIVFRDGSGNFSAGTITATLNGNASTATNADTLDSLDSTQFLRSDADDTTTGNLTVSVSGTPTFTVETSQASGQDALIKIAGARTGSNTADIGMVEFVNDTSSSYTLAQISAMDPSGAHASGNGKLVFRTSSGGTLSDKLVIPHTGDLTYDGNEVWTSGNDGSGSGLDADLWDGNQFSSYLNQAVLSTSSPSFAGLNINGNLNAVDNIYLASNLYHEGDTNSYLGFSAADDFRIVVGGRQILRCDEGTNPDKIQFYDANNFINTNGDFQVVGDITLSGAGTYLQFPDGTQQTTAATGGLPETTATTTSTSQTTIANYATATYGTLKLFISVKRGTARQASEMVVVHNGTTASATEYAQINTGSELASFEVDISGGNVRLRATATSSTSTSYTISEILVGA